MINLNSSGICSAFQHTHCVEKSVKNSHFYRYELTLILKPLVIRFCPLKMFSDSFRSFYTVNNQKLKETENIYKGQKRFTKGFFGDKCSSLRSQNWEFLRSFQTLCLCAFVLSHSKKTPSSLGKKSVQFPTPHCESAEQSLEISSEILFWYHE